MSDPDSSRGHHSDPLSDAHADPGGGDHAAHVSGDGHDAADSEPLGPVDVQTWGYALVGVALGLLVVVVLYLTSA